MEQYQIYRTIKVGDEKYIDTLICIAFTEQTAHEIVQAIRKSMGNQLCFFEKVNIGKEVKK